MSLKKFVGVLVVAGLMMLAKTTSSRVEEKKKIVGIIQTASHPALDDVCRGIVETLQKSLDVEVAVQNAEGMVAVSETIAKSMHANPNVAVVCTIGTMATGSMAHADHEKPIVMVAVSDPSRLGVVRPGTNVCGISDAIDVAKTVRDIQMIVKDIKTVAILCNPAEPNSESTVGKLEKECARVGITALKIGVTSEASVQHSARVACARGDAVLVPPDNTVTSMLEVVGREALQAKKPLLVCCTPNVVTGMVATLGRIDSTKEGVDAAEIIIKILESGQTPEQIGVQFIRETQTVVHKKTADAIGFDLSPSIPKENIQ